MLSLRINMEVHVIKVVNVSKILRITEFLIIENFVKQEIEYR